MMVLWISHKPWERGRLDQSMSILDRIVKTKKAARVGIDISSTTVKLLELSESNGGLVPSIDTTELTTQVLVGNGETVVLGGVFRNEETLQVQKVPVLGDLPGLRSLFRSTAIPIKR